MILFFYVYLFLRERERDSMSRGRAGRGRESIPNRLCTVSGEPDAGLELMTREIMT